MPSSTGGLLFNIGDATARCAARTNGDRYAEKSANVNYMENVGTGHVVCTSAVVKHRKQTTCLVDVAVTD